MPIDLNRSTAHALLLQRTNLQPEWVGSLRKKHLGVLYDLALARFTTRRARRTIGDRYAGEMAAEYKAFERLIESNAGQAVRILDIGCGLAGIDLIIYRALREKVPNISIVLLDRDGFSLRPSYGFRANAARYNELSRTFEFLVSNGIPARDVRTVNIDAEEFPEGPFDVVLSLLSWGYHYPVETYLPQVLDELSPAGVVILDVRVNSPGFETIGDMFEDVQVLDEKPKHMRLGCRAASP